MSRDSAILRSFAAGELAPALAARADLAKYASGARTLRNFVVQRHGGAANRPGTRFIDTLENGGARLLRYVSENEGESVLIEAGPYYLRFFVNGAAVTFDAADVDAWSGATAYVVGDMVTSGGNVYYAIKNGTNHVPPNATYWELMGAGAGIAFELDTIFDAGFNWSQSGRTITLTKKGYQPFELIYVAVDRWILRAIVTTTQVTKPTNLALGATTGALSYSYRVTAAHPLTYEESLPSNVAVDASSAAPTAAAPHSLTWDALTIGGVAVPEYYVYCDPYGNGTYGFIGTATGTNAFKNPGITPDFSLTPPIDRDLWEGGAVATFPDVSATFQQRRLFANTDRAPDGIEGSRVGFPSNFTISSPLQADDAISLKIAGNNHHAVRHLVDLKQLIALTGGGAWVIAPPEGKTLAPNELGADQVSYVGVSDDVRPVVLGNGLLYVEARGRQVFELRFDQTVEGLNGRDLTIYAAHLFDGHSILAMDLQLTPHPTLWCVRNDGVLLGLTYIHEENVWGWHRHDTQFGGWLDVCVVPEAGEDAVYLIGARTIGGVAKYWIEKLAKRTILDYDVDSFFVDAGLSYSGAAVTNVSGLTHLEGQRVAVLADGVVISDGDPVTSTLKVVGGAIHLSTAAKNIHVGLQIPPADLETLDLDVAGSSIADKRKRTAAVSIMLDKSTRHFKIGPDVNNLRRFLPASFDTTAKSFTGKIEQNLDSTFSDNGRVFIRHTDPAPLTILAVMPNEDLGG